MKKTVERFTKGSLGFVMGLGVGIVLLFAIPVALAFDCARHRQWPWYVII